MNLREYNGFTGAYREAMANRQRAMFEAGTLARPVRCEACGQDRGPIHAHQEDYRDPALFFGLCFRCHLALHMRFKHPEGWRVYREAVERGARFSPATRPQQVEAMFRGEIPVFELFQKPSRLLLFELDAGMHSPTLPDAQAAVLEWQASKRP